jgi:hypothetical protein
MFLGPPSNDASEKMLCGYVRAYIMHMISSILFISMIENAVQVMYIYTTARKVQWYSRI